MYQWYKSREMKGFDKKGISPVLATILLIALTIAAVGIVAMILSTVPATGAGIIAILTTGKVENAVANYQMKVTLKNWGPDDITAGSISIEIEGMFFPSGRKWLQATGSANWSPRIDHTSVVFDGKMWVIGGWDGSSYKNDVWYSSDGVTWFQATGNADWSPRIDHTSVVFDGKMWVIGGWDGSVKQDVWCSSDGVTWELATGYATWAARASHTSVVFDGKMWVMGGRGSIGWPPILFNDVWCSSDGIFWDEATDDAGWTPRAYPTSVVFDGKMWVMGGYLYYSSMNDVWHSDDGVTWTRATDSATWGPRYDHASEVFDGEMWVMGGLQGGSLKNDAWYSSDGVRWVQATGNAAWSPRYSHASVVFDDKMWVIGGWDGYSCKNDVWYSPCTPVYSRGSATKLPDAGANQYTNFSWVTEDPPINLQVAQWPRKAGPGTTLVIILNGTDAPGFKPISLAIKDSSTSTVFYRDTQLPDPILVW